MEGTQPSAAGGDGAPTARTCKCFLTIETGCMDPTNIIMFLLVFCVTGAMAVDPQAQKNQWNVLSGVTVWNGKPQYEFRINWFLLLCGALGPVSMVNKHLHVRQMERALCPSIRESRYLTERYHLWRRARRQRQRYVCAEEILEEIGWLVAHGQTWACPTHEFLS